MQHESTDIESVLVTPPEQENHQLTVSKPEKKRRRDERMRE